MSRAFFGDAAKYAPSYIVTAVAAVATLPILTRIFSTAEYGHYSLALTTVSLAMVLLSNWIVSPALRFLPEYELKGELVPFLRAYLFWLLTVSFGPLLLVALAYPLAAELLGEEVIFWSAGAVFFSFSTVSYALLVLNRANRQAGLYSLFTCLQAVLSPAIGIAFAVWLSLGVTGFLLGGVVASALLVIPIYLTAVSRENRIAMGVPRPTRSITADLLSFGIPTTFTTLSTWLMGAGDRYVIELTRGSDEVGLYAASYGVTERTLLLIATALAMADGPIAYGVWAREGREKSAELRRSVTRQYLLIAVPSAVGLCVVGKPLLQVLTAPEFHAGAVVIPWIVAGVFLLGLTQRYTIIFSLIKRPMLNMYCVLGAGILNVLLNLAFVPRWGFVASAVTTAVCYGFLLIATVILTRRHLPWSFPTRTLLRTTIASLGMALPAWLIAAGLTAWPIVNVLVAAVVGAVAYGLALVALGEVTREEIAGLRAMILRR